MRTFTLLALFAALTLSSGLANAGKKKVPLNRSIYLPVELTTCEHIYQAIAFLSNLEEEEIQPLARVPGRTTFQFTIYPALSRIEPEYFIVKMVGLSLDKPIKRFVTLFLDHILAGNSNRDLAMDKILKRLSYKLDAHHKTQHIKFECDLCNFAASTPEVRIAANK